MKRTGVKKNKMDRNGKGEASTSSTSLKMSQEQSLTTDNKIEGGNKSKKIKRGKSSNASEEEEVEVGQTQSQESIVKETSKDNFPCDESFKNLMKVEVGASQEEESVVKEASMNDLPPEMLMEILKCVNFRSLFKCRQVSRQWNEISSGMLRNTSNSSIRFECLYRSCSWTQYNRYEKKSLSDFVTCIKNSKDCPFSQFFFLISVDDDDPLKMLKQNDFEEFISHFASSNQTIKSLTFHFDWLNYGEIFQIFAPILSDLLLNKIPRLEELALNFKGPAEAPQVKLFSIPKLTKSTTLPVQLPQLKVLHLVSSMISSFTEILRDLLNAAVNLKSICMTVYKLTDLQLLNSMGKLHLLKEAKIELKPNFFSAAESGKNCAPLTLPLPTLTSFDLGIYWLKVESDPRHSTQAGNFFATLFESSKDTLTELKSEPIEFFPGLQLPIFTKLRKLDLTQIRHSPGQMFPPGIREINVFPFVSELGFDIAYWNSAFPQEDSIPVFPSVKFLILTEGVYEEINISVVALMCPNLIKLKLQKHARSKLQLKFFQGGRSIWTHLNKLESLEFDIDLDLSENNSTALDSCFTGISMENCQHLCKMKEAQETLKNYGVSVEVPESKFHELAQREFPSILDLKELKTFIINPYSGETLLKRIDFFKGKLSWISEEYAFKFLPHLKPDPEEEN